MLDAKGLVIDIMRKTGKTRKCRVGRLFAHHFKLQKRLKSLARVKVAIFQVVHCNMVWLFMVSLPLMVWKSLFSIVPTLERNDGNFPYPFPAPWASVFGEDDIGLWMTLTVQNVQQTFRWIEPDTFQMGSPEDELERWDKETQHEVTLTQGYWLAETACTQALWQAVMGDNPAYFKENMNNPVEQVSWDDVQDFIAKLNQLIPNLTACLPTEAQWEYACRAGTITPFSFGDNITSEQVNYDANTPYSNGQKSEYREKTVAVKSLPPNAWGLYEMHGNVWEWCSDWFGDYPTEVVTNPSGA